jgi:MFS family permease
VQSRPEPAAEPVAAGTLWRHRNFLLLWSGQTVSEMGSAVTQLALPLTAVVVLGASTFQVGLLTSAATAAFALIALPAGALVDRRAKRRLMIWCDVARMLIVFLVRVLRVRPAETGLLIAAASLGGVLGTLIGVRATLWIAFAGSWAAGWWVFFSPLRGMRALEDRTLEDQRAPGSGVPGQGGRELPDGAGPQLGD